KSEILGAIKKHADETTAAIQKADTEIKEFGKVAESTKNEIAALTEKGAALDARMTALEQEAVRGKGDGEGRRKTIGEILVDSKSESLKQYASQKRQVGSSFG